MGLNRCAPLSAASGSLRERDAESPRESRVVPARSIDSRPPFAVALRAGERDEGFPEILEWLEERTCFSFRSAASASGTDFTHSFLDYLRHRASRKIQKRRSSAIGRQATGLPENGLWQEAVKHALAAGDDTQAAAWVERCATN